MNSENTIAVLIRSTAIRYYDSLPTNYLKQSFAWLHSADD